MGTFNNRKHGYVLVTSVLWLYGVGLITVSVTGRLKLLQCFEEGVDSCLFDLLFAFPKPGCLYNELHSLMLVQ